MFHHGGILQAHRLFCVRAESKFGRDANLNTMNSYVDLLIEEADGRCYPDFCRLLSVMWWNL